jgi:hypothetical protein
MRSRVQRAGLAGLAFFAAKGLLWLVVPLLLATMECSG